VSSLGSRHDLRMEDCACPLGCPRDDELVLEGRDRLHELPGLFQVARCRTCGLLRTNPRPSRDEISSYYPEDYSPHKAREYAGPPQPRWRAMLGRMFDYRTTPIPPCSPGRLLEIGCGSGTFLRSMQRAGWHAVGVEPSPAAAATARAGGATVFTGGIEDQADPPQPYDLIAAWMVLEHLHDPVDALRRLRAWIRADGWLVLSVPDAGSLEFRLFRDRWYALQLPTHLFHFSRTTLGRVLAAGGWQLESVRHQRVLTNLAASTGYWLDDRKIARTFSSRLMTFGERPGRHHQILYPAAVILASLGQTGRMTVWARPAVGER
jgi:SAM-dependent methyltransferase